MIKAAIVCRAVVNPIEYISCLVIVRPAHHEKITRLVYGIFRDGMYLR